MRDWDAVPDPLGNKAPPRGAGSAGWLAGWLAGLGYKRNRLYNAVLLRQDEGNQELTRVKPLALSARIFVTQSSRQLSGGRNHKFLSNQDCLEVS